MCWFFAGLRFPLPLSQRNCRCGRPFVVLGHHHAVCARNQQDQSERQTEEHSQVYAGIRQCLFAETVLSRQCNRSTTRRQLSWPPKDSSYPSTVGTKNKKHTWSESRKISKGNSKTRLGILLKLTEADQLELASAKQIQPKQEMASLVAEQAAETAKAVNQEFSGNQPQATGSMSDKAGQQTILSVFKSVLAMQSRGCNTLSELLTAAGATE